MPVVCCMDDMNSKKYSYGGIGVGGGAIFTMNFGGERRFFKTSKCVAWEDHEGFGRATAFGLGVGRTWGILIVTTPQTYQSLYGWSWGLDASVLTTVGKWNLQGKQ